MNLKKLIITCLSISLGILSLNNCSGDSEILATFDGGTVTRGELKFVLEASKKGQSEPQPVTNDVQAKIVEGIALEKILLIDSISSKKVDLKDLEKIENLVSDFLKLNIYLREYVKTALKQKPLEFVDLQIAIIRGEDVQANDKRAEDLLTKLQSAPEKEISSLISEATDDQARKPIGGKLEPFCVNCSMNPLEDIIEEAKKVKQGKFVKFSKDNNGGMIYLVRITGKEKVNSARVAKYYSESFTKFSKEATEYGKSHTDDQTKTAIAYFTDGDHKDKGKQFAGQMLKQFEQGLYQSELNRIKLESGIVVNPMPQVFGPDQINPKNYPQDMILFTTKEKMAYTWKDLEQDFASVPNSLKADYKDEKAKIWDMINLFQSTLLQGKIGKESVLVQKIGTDTSYRMQLDKMRVSLALKALQDEVKAVPTKISEQQMKDTYEAGKLYAYSTEDPKNPAKRISLPYGQVREKIRAEMEGGQRNTFIEQKISGLKTTYNLKVAQDRLKEVIL